MNMCHALILFCIDETICGSFSFVRWNYFWTQLNSSREIYAVSTSHNGSFVFFGSSMEKIYDGEVAANWLGIIIITTTTKG